MKTIILDTSTLPVLLKKKLHADKVVLRDHNGGVLLIPLKKGSKLRGNAFNSKLTTDKLRLYKNGDKELDK